MDWESIALYGNWFQQRVAWSRVVAAPRSYRARVLLLLVESTANAVWPIRAGGKRWKETNQDGGPLSTYRLECSLRNFETASSPPWEPRSRAPNCYLSLWLSTVASTIFFVVDAQAVKIKINISRLVLSLMMSTSGRTPSGWNHCVAFHVVFTDWLLFPPQRLQSIVGQREGS